jgi:2Fe-2S ferredoxin
MTIHVTFVFKNGQEKIAVAEVDQTLLKLAHANGIDQIEGACGGAMACSTCHIVVDLAWYGKLPPASDDETDMLDLATGLTRTSRLGCQIKLTPQLDGLKVKLP